MKIKIKLKLLFRIGIITTLILLLGFIALLIPAIPKVQRDSHRMDCRSNIKGIFLTVANYQYKEEYRINHEKIPFLGDKTTGEEYWSWRAEFIIRHDYNDKLKFRLTERWNSEYNLPLFKNIRDETRNLFCSSDKQSEKASYVAVKGSGTVWTEMQNGNLSENIWDYAENILIIETSEPKNFWAEPGDDVSPEEVIRLFEADPGLVKNSKQKWYDRSHWPKHYVNAIGEVKSFGEIKDVEELRKLLTVSPEQIEAVRKKVEERERMMQQ